MKQTLLFIFLIVATALSVAQTPQSFKYQAVARDNTGNLISEQNVGIRITILQGGSSGTPVYSESFTAYTNLYGLFSVNVGSGTVLSGNFSSINWGSDTYFIKTEMDAAGGTTYSLMGTSQLLSVPYALYSENTANVDDADADPTNELQTLSINGNDLSISSGNTVVVPSGASEINDLTDGKTGGYSVFLGHQAGESDDGTSNRNAALGYEAMKSNTSGYYNTATGYQSLKNNIDGIYNSAYGYRSMYLNTSGSFNTAFGRGALHQNDTGSANTAFGTHALYDNSFGNYNTALGNNAGQLNTTGSNNTLVGNNANFSNTEGSNNTIIGHHAGYAPYSHSKSGNVFLGYMAGKYEYGSNKLYIENSSSSSPLIYGEFDNNIVNINGNLGVNNANPQYTVDIGTDATGGLRAKGTGNVFMVMEKSSALNNSFLNWRTNGVDKWVVGTWGSNDNFRIINWDNGGSNDKTFFINSSSGATGMNTLTPFSGDLLGLCPDNDYNYGLSVSFSRSVSGSAYGVYVPIDHVYNGNSNVYGLYTTISRSGTGSSAIYGVRSYVAQNETGTGTKYTYGANSHVSIGSPNGTSYAYGVRGSVSGSYSYGYGIYFSGGLAGSGTKSAVVRTAGGPKEVYCLETPGNWFEDFGHGSVNGGQAIVEIAPDFLQTVTVNTDHPMNVFITPTSKMGEWWIEKRDATFVLHAPDAADGSTFDYRVVAKRKGYEDIRLREAPAAYTDHYLYPDIKDVPAEHRAEWVRLIDPKQRNAEWMSYLTPDEVKLLNEEEREERKAEETKKSDPAKSSTD